MAPDNTQFFKWFIDLLAVFGKVANVIWVFLFESHFIGFTIPFINYDVGFDINMFTILLTGGFVAFLILALVKQFVPLA